MTKANKNTALTAAIMLALAGFAANNAHAIEFGNSDGLNGTVHTTLSYGVDVRTEDPSSDDVAKAVYNPLVGTLTNAQQRAAKGAFSANHDDGDLNYSAGSAFSIDGSSRKTANTAKSRSAERCRPRAEKCCMTGC